jgi:hypothetical protein
MAVTDDILATYRAPRAVMTRILAGERHEGRALAYLLAAVIVIHIAQWPGMARAAFVQPDVPLSQRMFAAFLAVLAAIPAFYGLAALAHLIARAFGGRGSYFGARIALFWALLATTPLMLFQGMLAAFAGPGPGLTLTGVVVFAVFLWFWMTGLRVAEFARPAAG